MSISDDAAPSAASPTETEIRAFTQRNADYYLKKWQPVLAGEKVSAGFNFAAFFLGALWLGYRRMWKITCTLYAVFMAALLLEQALYVGLLHQPVPRIWGTLLSLGVAVVCGSSGNRWYLDHASRAVARVRQEGLHEETAYRLLAQRGGANLVPSFCLFLLFLMVAVVLQLLVFPVE